MACGANPLDGSLWVMSFLQACQWQEIGSTIKPLCWLTRARAPWQGTMLGLP